MVQVLVQVSLERIPGRSALQSAKPEDQHGAYPIGCGGETFVARRKDKRLRPNQVIAFFFMRLPVRIAAGTAAVTTSASTAPSPTKYAIRRHAGMDEHAKPKSCGLRWSDRVVLHVLVL